MAIAWVNFRGNAAPGGFVGDGADSIYCLGDVYPTGRKIGGVYDNGYGGTGNAANAADDGTYNTSHQYGRCGSVTSNDNNTFRINGLVIGHTYRFYASMGLIFATQNCGFTLYSDNRVTTIVNVAGGSVVANSMMDIAGTSFTSPALWAAGQAYYQWVATTNDVYFCKSTSGNNAYLNAIGLEDVTPAATSGSATVMMMGV